MEHEIWKDISGYEGVYQASSEGRVRLMVNRRGMNAEKILTPKVVNSYHYVTLMLEGEKHTCLLQRLILETFAPRRNSARLKVIRENDCLDDNRLENLIWVTRAEAERRRLAKHVKGENVRSAKLTDEIVREIRRLYAAGLQQVNIAPRFGVSQAAVSRVCSGRTWAHVA